MRRTGRTSGAGELSAAGGVLAALVLVTGVACTSGAASTDAGARAGTDGRGAAAGGTAGASATGGAGGTPDDGSADGPLTTTGQFTIVYNGTLTSHLTTCASCVGGYTPSYGIAQMVYTMENAAGAPHTTAVSITIGPGSLGATYAVNLAFLEDNPTLASMYQGEYAYPNALSWMNVAPGVCFTFPELNLVSGGGVSGSLDCELMGASANNLQVSAHITGTFSSSFVY